MVTILGSGVWGKALSSLLKENKQEFVFWDRFSPINPESLVVIALPTQSIREVLSKNIDNLKNATIKNGVLVCPRHQWNFDLNSHGQCIAGGNKDLPIYEITEIDEAENTGMS